MATEDDAPLPSDEVRERAAQLFLDLLDEADKILRAGTTQNKIALMKSVIPALMRELQSQNEAAAAAAMKEGLDSLFSAARGKIAGFETDAATGATGATGATDGP